MQQSLEKTGNNGGGEPFPELFNILTKSFGRKKENTVVIKNAESILYKK